MRHAIIAAALWLTAGMAAAQQEGLSRLAEKHGVPAEELSRLEREQGLSWSDVGYALAISKRAKRPLSEVAQNFRSGLTWPQVSALYQLDHAQIDGEARRFERDAHQAGVHERFERRDEPPPPGGERRGRVQEQLIRDRERGPETPPASVPHEPRRQ